MTEKREKENIIVAKAGAYNMIIMYSTILRGRHFPPPLPDALPPVRRLRTHRVRLSQPPPPPTPPPPHAREKTKNDFHVPSASCRRPIRGALTAGTRGDGGGGRMIPSHHPRGDTPADLAGSSCRRIYEP